ncbi:MAG: hypothetical protein ABJQ29_03340 [Luteolibacter sp.]
MSCYTRLLRLLVPVFLISSAHGVVEDWFMDKGIIYQQSADGVQPSVAVNWTIEVAVETTDPGEIGTASISRVGSGVSHPLVFDDGEWTFDKFYQSEAAMNAEFPSNSDYTITIEGGSLGLVVQTFTLGAANYPNVPYLVGSDLSRVQSIDAESDFVFHWNSPGTFGNGALLEIDERQTNNEVGYYEFDGALPEEFLLAAAADSLEGGHSYEGYLSFQNVTDASGAGSFGTVGYIQHSRNLSFDLQTVLSPSVDAIVGAWQFGDGASDASGVLVFQANGVYFHAEDIPDGSGGDSDGIERGTYTWNEGSGVLTATPQVDTNGSIGLSHPNGTDIVEINGDTMSLTDNDETSFLQRVAFNSVNHIEGGWRICDNGGSNTGVLVFLDNGIYFHAEVDGVNDGMERGTYNWNPGTGVLASTQAVDTNGDNGLSDPLNGTDVATFPTPRVMEVFDGERFYLHRVTNAAVMPDWRLNKARNFNQAADNTAPTTAIFWDVHSQVETRNADDATTVSLSGGGLSSPVTYGLDDPGEWFYEKDYATENLLDTEFPDSQVYTITISGGELGTVSQEINIGGKDFPTIPYLVDAVFTDAQSIDPTLDFDLDWNTPSNSTDVSFVVSSLPNEGGTEFFDGYNLGLVAGTTIPAQSVPAGFHAYGYLEFSKFLNASNGAGGFGVSGFSSRHSITLDLPVNAMSASELVSGAAEEAGLMGASAEPDAIPFADGVENILKYAFNMDLSMADVSTLTPGSGNSGLPVFNVEGSGSATATASSSEGQFASRGPVGSEFKVEFIRRKGSGLTYTPKISTTLLPDSFSEMTGTETVSPVGTDGKFERVVVRQPYDPAVTPKAFGIVEVSGM